MCRIVVSAHKLVFPESKLPYERVVVKLWCTQGVYSNVLLLYYTNIQQSYRLRLGFVSFKEGANE